MQIRKYLAYVDADPPLGGHVEIDETLVGGKHKGGGSGRNAQFKTIVLGMVERNGDVITRVIPNVSRKTLEAHIIKHVKREAKVTTNKFGHTSSSGCTAMTMKKREPRGEGIRPWGSAHEHNRRILVDHQAVYPRDARTRFFAPTAFVSWRVRVPLEPAAAS